jgi:hypothetical protein
MSIRKKGNKILVPPFLWVGFSHTYIYMCVNKPTHTKEKMFGPPKLFFFEKEERFNIFDSRLTLKFFLLLFLFFGKREKKKIFLCSEQNV